MVKESIAKIRIKGLFKIFGPKAAAMTDRVAEVRRVSAAAFRSSGRGRSR